MRLIWITDPHFDHAPLSRWQDLVADIHAADADGLILSGDISVAEDLTDRLVMLVTAIDLPIYFVLGNHDFYGGRIADVRRRVSYACRQDPRLNYLTDAYPITLTQTPHRVVLVGDDGWGDGKVGDLENTPVQLSDFDLIHDLRELDRPQWAGILRRLGEECAQRLSRKLDAVLEMADPLEIVIVTHVPPLRQACWYQGQPTDDHWAPYFVCGAIGEMLMATAAAATHHEFRVLCGHTHHEGVCTPLENLTIHTGAAQYGNPAVQPLRLRW
ncbi:MAG: metallophosphoesterase [Planctomycetota bacterium]